MKSPLSSALRFVVVLFSLQRVECFAPTPRSPSARQSSSSLGALSELADAYTYGLTHYQLATESATTACLAGIGDLVAQVVSQQQSKKQIFGTNISIDWSRYWTFVQKGAVSGIAWSHWYAFCDGASLQFAQSLVSDNESAVRAVQLMTSIVMEQFVWCPLLYSLWDVPFPMLSRGDDIKEIPAQVKSKIGPLLLENAKVWTFANLLVYNIPLQWRVVIVSLTDVVWQSILSSSIATPPLPPAIGVFETTSGSTRRANVNKGLLKA